MLYTYKSTNFDINDDIDLTNFQEAILSPNYLEWMKAINDVMMNCFDAP